jgi:RNA polymerase sigma-70 factor (ECF subfamily)
MTPSEPRDDATESLDLVRRAQAEDHAALDRLFERYYERIRRIVRIRLGADLRSCVESGDILQETFICAVHDFDRFEMRDEASLIHWLSRIAEHRIKAAADYHGALKRDHRRAVALRHVQDAQASGELILEPAADGPQPLDEMVEEEAVRAVESCMRELSDEHREVILQRDYMDASWELVAERIDSPSPDAARMLYSRAVTELAQRMRRVT